MNKMLDHFCSYASLGGQSYLVRVLVGGGRYLLDLYANVLGHQSYKNNSNVSLNQMLISLLCIKLDYTRLLLLCA